MARANYKAMVLMDSIKSGFGSISDAVFSGFFSSVNREADVLIDKLEERALALQERLLKNLAVALVIGIAGAFIIFSAYFYLVESQQMSKAGAFLLLGILMIIAGWLIKKTQG